MIQVETINLTGTKAEKTNLPAKIFGVKINPLLMAQAVKIYLSNQRTAKAHAKTRSEVDRTTAKWFRQKGTGRARHGSRSAPIFADHFRKKRDRRSDCTSKRRQKKCPNLSSVLDRRRRQKSFWFLYQLLWCRDSC